jgi:hypothetical protein
MVAFPRNSYNTFLLAFGPSWVLYTSYLHQSMPSPYYGNENNIEVQLRRYSTPIHLPHKTTPNQTDTEPFDKSQEVNMEQEEQQEGIFAGCLLVMDDNAILPEFLAYHYMKLPLRRLIVAIDPRSETSPKHIFNRYTKRGLMNITIWNDADFIPTNHEKVRAKVNKKREKQGLTIYDPLVNMHRDRQSYFISKCLSTLKDEGAKWVIHIDTDEYILPNYYAKNPYIFNLNYLRSENEHNRLPTVYDMIQSKKHVDEHLGSACISFPRVRIGTKESQASQVNSAMPVELLNVFNASNFQTLRWRWRNQIIIHSTNGLSKTMIDVTRIPHKSLLPDIVKHNPHRPVQECLVRNMYVDARRSPFLAHHYAGTWEQWTARKRDARRTTDSNGRTWEAYQKLERLSKRQTDHIRPWLQDFVDLYGPDLTMALLKGVGESNNNEE